MQRIGRYGETLSSSSAECVQFSSCQTECAGAIPRRSPHPGRSPPISANLGAEVGLLAVLHTRVGTRRCRFHLHCLVRGAAAPGVGSQITPAGDR